MSRRKQLHQRLMDILGSSNVYFQPPESVKLMYPCIVYSLTAINADYADDKTYGLRDSYQVSLISKNHDHDEVRAYLLALPYCHFNQRFVHDNLYHDIFTIYY